MTFKLIYKFSDASCIHNGNTRSNIASFDFEWARDIWSFPLTFFFIVVGTNKHPSSILGHAALFRIQEIRIAVWFLVFADLR